MEVFSLSSFFILLVVSLFQTNGVGGNSLSTCGEIFEGDSGEFEYHRENANVDDLTGSSVCIWMIKLLEKDGAGVSLKLEDLDQNSVVNFHVEGEPTDPVKPPNTLNSSQINSAVELSGNIFIITLKSQLHQFENSPTKFVVSWNSLEKLPAADSNSNGGSPIEVSCCPPDSQISPCTCEIHPPNVAQIYCVGSVVNESSIENTFREIRRVNGIPEDRGIEIYSFGVESTELTQLDLAPFYKSQIEHLYIKDNFNLTQLLTSGNPRDHGSIHVDMFDVYSSPLSRSGFGDALKYFSNEMHSFFANGFDLSEYNDSFEDGGEFLPGFSVHTNLQLLSISNCNISGRLSFDTLIPKELQNLRQIGLSANSINEIGQNVFDFPGFSAELYIALQSNKLNESSFHPNSGIARAGRGTTLELFGNQIRTLPAPIFETFLDAHLRNYLAGNPLICDERVSWLKSRRAEFERRVFDVYCSNDEGHSVFDSDLIP